MGADLHIHIIPNNALVRDVECFLKCDASTTRDGKTIHMQTLWVDADGNEYPFWQLPEGVQPVGMREVVYEYDHMAVLTTDCVWIGEVSWLKADLFDSPEEFIPQTVQAVADLLPGIVDVTPEFIAAVGACFDRPNATGYRLAEPNDVVGFLQQHVGKKAYQISH